MRAGAWSSLGLSSGALQESFPERARVCVCVCVCDSDNMWVSVRERVGGVSVTRSFPCFLNCVYIKYALFWIWIAPYPNPLPPPTPRVVPNLSWHEFKSKSNCHKNCLVLVNTFFSTYNNKCLAQSVTNVQFSCCTTDKFLLRSFVYFYYQWFASIR